MTVVADNLPDYMQYLDLVRDCIELFSLVPLPPNMVETQHVFGRVYNRSYAYAAEDHRLHAKDEKSEIFDLTEHNRWQEQGRKYRSNKKKRELESQNGGSVSEETQSQTEAPESSEANSSSQLPLEQDSNEDTSSLVDPLPNSEE
jgi:hypothetical protein